MKRGQTNEHKLSLGFRWLQRIDCINLSLSILISTFWFKSNHLEQPVMMFQDSSISVRHGGHRENEDKLKRFEFSDFVLFMIIYYGYKIQGI